MKQFARIVFFVLAAGSLYAQTARIFGNVIDSQTGQPLPFTNVYVNNTTIGVITNAAGDFVLPKLPIGTADVVFSFIGYRSQQVKINIKATANSPLSIRLMPDDKQVMEVTIKASRDKVWEKQLKQFEKIFLGNTSACKILNPWVLDFSAANGIATAIATIPLEIDNNSLGYKLFFQLKKFDYTATTFAIIGTIRFVEQETSDASVALKWVKNREYAYRGSAKHLMKAILDRQLTKQGFAVYRDKVKGKPRSTNFSTELQNNLTLYDTTALAISGTNVNEYIIAIKDRMEVHYTNEFTTANFYKDVANPVSWLDVKGGYVLVNKDGTMLNPADVAISGNMSDTRVSGMLPLDYKPGSVIGLQSPARLLAKKRHEKVYLHTDKPYYYPGDNIWFSAYMNYRLPGLMDTLSNVLYVDLINADRIIVQNRILPIDSGRAANSFRLPTRLLPGTYMLRAYTQWMRNYGIDQFFLKPLIVLPIDKRVDDVAHAPVSDNSLKIIFDKPVYNKRSPVRMTIGFDTTALKDLITSSFSVSVFDETTTIPVAEPTTIKTDFDLLEPATDMSTTFNHPIERGITVSGIYRNRKGKAEKTKLTLLPEDLGSIYPLSTDNNGVFSLKGLAFYDSTRFAVQPAGGDVRLVARDAPDLPEKLPDFTLRTVPALVQHTTYPGDTLPTRMLAEVKVSATKLVRSESSYGQPDFYLKGENLERYASIAEAIAAKLPSFKLIYDQINWYLIWARSGVPTSSDIRSGSDLHSHEPNLYIDNVMTMGISVGDRLMQLNPTLIDHIEVNGMITANQGANGSSGLINVFTKKVPETNSKGLTFIKARGFDRERLFVSPNYDSGVTKASLTDFRSTLYWNPRVRLDAKKGTVELTFFTSDQAGRYRVVIEGVTSQKNTIHAEAQITVKD